MFASHVFLKKVRSTCCNESTSLRGDQKMMQKFLPIAWGIFWIVSSIFFYFFLIPVGIQEPSYSYQSPSAFPKFLAIFIGVMGAVLTRTQWKFPSLNKRWNWSFLAPAGIGLGYVLAMPYLGFLLSTIITLSLLLYILGEKRWRIVGVISVGGGVVVHLGLLKLLHVPLPQGPFGW